MNIVLEGADNSGKSTLAKYIQEKLNIQLVPGEGPEKYPGEINERVKRYLQFDGVLFDRHPCISQEIYRLFSGTTAVDPDLIFQFYGRQPLIIWCVGRDSLDDHVIKDHDTPEHQIIVQQHHANIILQYQTWAMGKANVIYRIGDDMDRIVRLLKKINRFDPYDDIMEFHQKFRLEYTGRPRVIDEKTLDFRIKFLKEELGEYEIHSNCALSEASQIADLNRLAGPPDPANVTFHLAEALDGLVDLVYVALGTAHLHGFDFQTAWGRVHAANMAKVRASDAGQSKRGSTLDVVKPVGWEAPYLTDLVETHIHQAQVTKVE